MKELLGYKKSLYYISFPLSFIGFILPIYAASLGATPIEVGMLYSIFSLCSVMIRPICGTWIDKRGRKGLFVMGIIAYTIVIILFIVGNSYRFILLARIIQSIASSFIWISGLAMISDVTSNDNKSKTIGSIDQVASKGGITGSFIGFSLLFSRFDNPFRYIFLIYLVSSLIALYYGIVKTKETLNHKVDNKCVSSEKKEGKREPHSSADTPSTTSHK